MAVSISGNSVLAGKTQVGQAFLLDDYRDAAAAYSLRKLRYAYQGPAVRVRRSFDNTEQDIGFDSFGNLDETTLQTFCGENLLQRSEEFDNAYWSIRNGSVLANNTTDPFGGSSADKYVENTSNTIHGININNSSISATVSTTYTLSYYVKSNGRNVVFNPQLGLNNVVDGSGNYTFNLSNGTYIGFSAEAGYTAFTNVGASISDQGNGWYRCSCTFTTSSGQNQIRPYIWSSNNTSINNGAPTYLGDGTSGIYLWGAQLNTGSLKPYVQTTTAARDGMGYVTKWYDQSTGSQQNLLQRSEQFDNASWLKYKSSISANSTATADPIGTNLSDRLIEDNTTDSHFVGWSTSYTISTSTTYTFSVYAKSNGRNLVVNVPLYVSGTITGAAYYLFDLTLGVFISCGIHSTYNIFTNNGASIVNVGNGWYRCSAFFTTSATQNNFAPYFMLANSNSATYTSAPNYAGDGSSGIYLWGAQLNTGSSPRNYTPTTSSTIDALRDASQPTAASQPRIVNAGVVEKVNGKAACYFDGSNDCLPCNSIATVFSGTNKTINLFVANKQSVSAGYKSIMSFGGTGYTPFWGIGVNSSKIYVYKRGDSNTLIENNTNTSNDGTFNLLTVFDTGSNLYTYKNSNIIDNNFSFSVGSITLTHCTIGAITYNTGNDIVNFINGNISEFIIYLADKSSPRTAIESNINTYYNIY